ncbi:MAG: isopeptide-forming domain-containing fimbrial protein [Oscillospiraceae bacterium]|nr:isopeptide-forming domain-containing fimbrial protein [Oscillospiraceae bacterium]
MKKVLAIVLCLIMVFSLSANAFAAPHSHTITIFNNQNTEYVYTAYQVFSGDLGSKGVLSNIVWGTGVNGEALLAALKAADSASYGTCSNAADVAAVVAAKSTNSVDDPFAIEFAEIVAEHIALENEKTPVTIMGTDSTYNTTEQHHQITGLEDGYYIVINETISDAPNSTYSRHMLKVIADVKISHKGEFPTTEKKIVEGESRVDVNEAGVGEDVNYEIVGTLPANLNDYETYYYAFRDTLSKGLTYKGETVRVTVNGIDVTEYFYVSATPYAGTGDPYEGGTEIYVGIQDLLALELLEVAGAPVVGDITKDTKVVLTYSATVNENALIGVEGNPNKVRLEYDNNPNTEGVPTLPPPPTEKPEPTEPPTVTPDDEVETYVTAIRVEKIDGQSNILTGAEFTLSGDAVKTLIVTRETFVKVETGTGTHYKLKDDAGYTTTDPVEEDDPATDDIDERTSHLYESLTKDYAIEEVEEVVTKTESVEVKAFVGEDGKVTFTGLGAGDYTLTESVTPAGYNTIEPIEFTIEFHPENKEFICTNSNIQEDMTSNTFFVVVRNVAGSTLPSTGGIGTTMFYIAGGILFVGALVFLVTKKRMSE